MDNVLETAVVSVGATPTVSMVTDGQCVTNTARSLEQGVGTDEPMSPATVQKARAQAVTLLERILVAYEADVASGEVGAQGSGVASGSPPRAVRCPTGLMYGRIQSGKTVGMITLAALALDNSFRVVVVLTSDNVKLVEQTAARFSALDGIVMDSTTVKTWNNEVKHVKKHLKDVGLVIVCSKNSSHLTSLVHFLKNMGSADYPALVMDDEADQATLDTTVAARTAGKPNAPKDKSTTYRKTIENERVSEEGLAIGQVLKHYVFLQVTATPYALLLQNVDHPLRPKFTSLLQPGDGYTGGETFFSAEHLDEELPPLNFVREEESAELEAGDVSSAPEGLTKALSFFLVSSAAQAIVEDGARAKSQNFLCHTSQSKTEHDKVAELIRGYLDQVGDELRKDQVTGEIAINLERAHTDLQRTVPHPPDLPRIYDELRRRLPKRTVPVVNSDQDAAEFSRGLNFIVGGNILGRGLTIKNLLVTYYLRSAKVSQMDTMLQHARMFGYRRPLMPYTRVFVPERLALRFHRIHEAEQHLRQLLADPDQRSRIPVEVGEGLKATRSNVLDMSAILAYTPGQHLYPGAPLVTRTAHREHDLARQEVAKVGGKFSEDRGEHEVVEISISDIVRLVGLLPYDTNDADNWDRGAIKELLASNSSRFGNRGWLYCRRMQRTKFRQGALSGSELKKLRGLSRPTLCIFLDDGHEYVGSRVPYESDFVYPSLVLPADGNMPAHVFNVTD